MLTTAAINSFKTHIDRTIAYAKYKIGDTYYQVPIHKRETLSDGRVAVYFTINTTGAGTITEVQLYDTKRVNSGHRKSENVVVASVQNGVFTGSHFQYRRCKHGIQRKIWQDHVTRVQVTGTRKPRTQTAALTHVPVEGNHHSSRGRRRTLQTSTTWRWEF